MGEHQSINQSNLKWEMGNGKWEMGIWNLEFGIWNLEFGIWNLYKIVFLSDNYLLNLLKDHKMDHPKYR